MSMNIKDLFFAYINKLSGVSNIVTPDSQSAFFDINNLHYYFYYDAANDPYYFRIMLPIVDNITEENRASVLEKSSRISTFFKVGKVVFFNNQVWFSVETFIYDVGDNISLLFDRMVQILQLMYEDYMNPKDNNNR